MRISTWLCCLVATCTWGEFASAQPANDECVGATPVALGTNAISNLTATLGLDPLPVLPCVVLGAMDGDVWYTFTAASTVAHEFNTCNLAGGWDTDMALYEGSCGALVELACNGDGVGLVGCQAFYSRLTVNLTAGTTYFVRIGSWDPADFNSGVLNILAAAPEDCTNGIDDDFDGLTDCFDPDCIGLPQCAPPANDECVGATAVVVGTNPTSNINATLGLDPLPVLPCAVLGAMDGDVWYTFTATSTAAHEFNTCNLAGGWDTDMALYEGACGALVELACNGDGVGLVGCQAFYSRLTANLTAGTTYFVRIGSWDPADFNNGVLNILVAAPEACADGIDNDFDGLTDCADIADCPTGMAPCIEDCADGIDNDADGLVDCLDTLDCTPGMAPCIEICDDGFDNDTDGLVDCNDGECSADVTCLAGGNDFCGGALPILCGDIVMGDTAAATAEPWPTCGTTSGTGGGVWYQFAGNGDQVTLSTCSLGTNYDTKIRVWSGSCVAPVCVAGNDDDFTCAINGLHSRVAFLTTPGETYFILVHGFAANQGLFEMTVTCLTPGLENCMNGLDDDLDGLVDCFDPDCSAIPACAPPANDDCAGAISVGLGATAFDTTLATDSAVPGPTVPCNGAVGQFNQDVWFEFTPATTASYLIDTCTAGGFDTDMLIYTGGCGGLVEEDCSGDGTGLVGCQIFYSALTLPLNAGTSYLIRIGGFGAGTFGTGSLNIAVDCGGIDPLTCTYDCATDLLAITWTDNPQATAGYNILQNGVMVGSVPAGVSSFSLSAPMVGTNTYSVEWACALGGNGASSQCTVNVQPPIAIPGGTTDLILHLEDVPSGSFGDINSGVALEAALVANGRSVARVASPDFDVLISSGCLNLAGVQTLWVMTGSFPNDYRISVGEGDALASLAAAGTGIYFEATDHWAFLHTVSGLDQRDGVDEAASGDGDDSHTQIDGVNAPLAGLDLSASQDIPYPQDTVGSDFTDQLAISTTDPVTSAEVITTNSDDVGGETAYITGIIAVHTDGGVMISTSWEFGGFDLDPLNPAASDASRVALAAAYLTALGRTGPVGDFFKRGDCNNDNGFNIADAVFLLGNLFPPPGSPPNVLACRDACDGNDDGGTNIADAVAILGALFPPPGSPPTGLPSPFGACGVDPTADSLDCTGYNHCP
ncbi:MAG: hypothetical protein AB7O52_05805 [Planctomycetota bacterium]